MDHFRKPPLVADTPQLGAGVLPFLSTSHRSHFPSVSSLASFVDTQSFLSIAVLHIMALGSLGPTGLSSATIKGHAESLLKILCQLPHPSGLVLRTPSGPPLQLPSPCPVSCWVPSDPLPPPLAPTPLIRMLFLNSRAHLSLYCSPPCCGSRCYEENFGTLGLALSALSGHPSLFCHPSPSILESHQTLPCLHHLISETAFSLAPICPTRPASKAPLQSASCRKSSLPAAPLTDLTLGRAGTGLIGKGESW